MVVGGGVLNVSVAANPSAHTSDNGVNVENDSQISSLQKSDQMFACSLSADSVLNRFYDCLSRQIDVLGVGIDHDVPVELSFSVEPSRMSIHVYAEDTTVASCLMRFVSLYNWPPFTRIQDTLSFVVPQRPVGEKIVVKAPEEQKNGINVPDKMKEDNQDSNKGVFLTRDKEFLITIENVHPLSIPIRGKDCVADIILDSTETRVVMYYPIPYNDNPWWFTVSSTTMIVDRKSGDRYMIRGVAENYPMDKLLVAVGCNGIRAQYTLIFPPLKPGVKEIDIVWPYNPKEPIGPNPSNSEGIFKIRLADFKQKNNIDDSIRDIIR